MKKPLFLFRVSWFYHHRISGHMVSNITSSVLIAPVFSHFFMAAWKDPNQPEKD
jgi:hypothetical protein